MPTKDVGIEQLSNNVSELATFVSENKPKHKLDLMKQYMEELRTGQVINPQPNEFSKELERCANKVKLLADSLDKIQEKAVVYKPQDPERDKIMAKAIDETITYGILRIIEDFFRVIFGDWWTEFESQRPVRNLESFSSLISFCQPYYSW